MPYNRNYLINGGGRTKPNAYRSGGGMGLTSSAKRFNLVPPVDPFAPYPGAPTSEDPYNPWGDTPGFNDSKPGSETHVGEENLGLGEGGSGGNANAAGTQRGFYGDLRRLRQNEVSQQIADIIARKGKTDPARLNLQLSDISRGTEANQQQLQGTGALVGGSGVLAALNAAVGQGGTETRSRAIADENARAEERQRQDILNLVLGPLERKNQLRVQKRIAALQNRGGSSGFDIGGLLGVLGPLLKGLGGGSGSGFGGDTGGTGSGGYTDSSGFTYDDNGNLTGGSV